MEIKAINNVKEKLNEVKNNFTPKQFAIAEKFLDLGKSKDLLLVNLDEKERAETFQILAKLMKEGIIGYRYYVVDGKIEKHYIENEIADKRLSNSTPVKINLHENGILI